MGRVAGIIAHEINNPLAAITNIFFLLRNHPSLDDEARHCAAMAEQELQRVAHITRQTLSFYRESKTPIAVHVDRIAGRRTRAAGTPDTEQPYPIAEKVPHTRHRAWISR